MDDKIAKMKTEGMLAHLPPLRRRQFLAGAAAAAGVGALGLPRMASAQSGSTLRISSYTNPSSMDPAIGGNGGDHVYLWNFYDTLIEWDFDTLAPIPSLAKAWEFTDPTTLVLTLEEGVTFHDGSPFNAEAVVFNLERNRGAETSNVKPDLATIESTEATGEYEVTIRLKQPDTALPLILSDRAGMMVSPTALGNDPEANVNRNAVGAGPWKFVSWTDHDKVEGTRNEAYWRDGQPAMDNLVMTITPERATAMRAVQSGQSDLAYSLSETQKTLIERLPNLKLVEGPTVYIFQLYLNRSRGPLQDARVRQALQLAIDREAYVQATQAGVGEPARMFLPQAHWAYSEAAAEHVYFDLDRAKALMKEAGLESGFEIDFVSYTDQAFVQRQEVVLEQLSKINVRGAFRNGPVPDIVSRFMGKEKSGDSMLSAWTGRPDPTQTYDLLFSENSFYNPGRTPPPEGFAEALAESRATSDQEKRKAAFDKVQTIVMREALAITLSVRYEVNVATTQVSGFVPNLLGKPKFREVKVG